MVADRNQPPLSAASGERITLTGAQETLLATLYGRARDSRTPRPILGDDEAARAVRRIDYDFAKTGITPTTAAGVAMRAKYLDDWTRQFLDRHGEATVLHLACGLDTRVHRIDPPPSVRWVDVDLPDVVELRRRLLPKRCGDYRMVAASVTDEGWLREVPADRPTVVVFEGLSMYLHAADGKHLVQRITDRFGRGELLFDCYSTLAIRMQKLVPAVRNAGARLQWGIDDPREIEGWHEGLTCVDAVRSIDIPGLDRLPLAGRVGMRMMAWIPGLREMGQILRYRF